VRPPERWNSRQRHTGAGRGFGGGTDLKDLTGPAGLLPNHSAKSKRQGLRLG